MISTQDGITTTSLYRTTVPEIVHDIHKISFSWYDYVLFTVMLTVSGIIGIYFGCFGSKQSTTSEYLLGEKRMKVIPIAISLVASHISGITLLAVPADVYIYGSGYLLGTFTLIFMATATVFIFLPVFYELKITSTYEYLERRFDSRIRKYASFLFGICVFVLLPIVIYVPALAFSAATGISVHIVTPIFCGVCVFYTAIGGLKAVVWTDTLQFTVTLGALFAVFILGLKSAGGFAAVFMKALEGHRLDIFDMDIDPTKRDTFWVMMLGMTFHWIAHSSTNQTCVQKYLSVPTLRDAKITAFYYSMGLTMVKTISVFIGLIMFKKYSDCDPLETHQINKKDQLLPYFVMDVAGSIPGLPGLFIAGIFCAALSTLSAHMNCLAGTIYEDFIVKLMPKDTTEKTASNMLKLLVLIIGAICTAVVYVVEHLGAILALSISFVGVAQGPLLGMFTLGILVPKANTKGALGGSITSLICMSLLVFVTKYYQYHGWVQFEAKPVSTDGCDFAFNMTVSSDKSIRSPVEEPFYIFRVSFYYYTLIGTVITVVVGLVISYATSNNDHPVDKNLIAPALRFLITSTENSKQGENGKIYHDIDGALSIMTENNK